MTNFHKDKQQIIDWLDKYQVNNYTLIPDEKYSSVVNVDSNVFLNDENLTSIPVKFNIIKGDFYCENNKLTSLEFCPEIVNGDFYFNCNPKLKKLQLVRNFNLIYLEHKKILATQFAEILATQFAEKLSNDLPSDFHKKNVKIKI